jgi:hypothetical protein
LILIEIYFFKRCAGVISTYRLTGYAAQDGEAQLFLSATLAQTFNNLSSALTGAAITVLALAEPFIAAGAAVAFIRCSLLFFKGPHGLVVPSRLGPFLLQKKVKPPRL